MFRWRGSIARMNTAQRIALFDPITNFVAFAYLVIYGDVNLTFAI